jgi:hypothetical protein
VTEVESLPVLENEAEGVGRVLQSRIQSTSVGK